MNALIPPARTLGCCLALFLAPLARGQTFERRTPVVVAIEKVGPAVVNISTATRPDRSRLDWFQLFEADDEMLRERMHTLGSGVVIDPRGILVTNQHVVMDLETVTVTFRDGRETEATVLNSDMDNDVAVLRVKPEKPLPFVEIGSSSDLMIGETCIAVGSPFGLTNSATTGIISALNRPVRFRGREVYRDFLQTSAVIHPGNSGGPLLDINGRLIGINVGIHSGGAGIGFAIPADRVRDTALKLLDFRITRGATLGLDVAGSRNGDALRVEKVAESGPAARAGIRLGDEITAMDGRPLTSALDLKISLLERNVGDEIGLSLRRGRETLSARVPFEAVPDAENPDEVRRRLGLGVTDAAALARRLGGRRAFGVVVTRIEPEGPADLVDVRKGDVLIQIGRYALSSVRDLQRILNHFPGERTFDLALIRNGEKYTGQIRALP